MTKKQNVEWMYSKAAFILDYEQATSVTVALVKRNNIREATELKTAVLSGLLEQANQRSKTELLRCVMNHCRCNENEKAAILQLNAVA